MKTGGYKKGMALAFPLRFTRGFEMEKKVRKWVEEWQKLPYVSPYEDGSRLPPKSDVWEKWAVGMVHELLSLMVPKKTEKGNLELLARHVGLPSAFRRMIFNHPGIFYVSNKLRTQTVVLREAYQRDLLAEKHPLMGFRYQYIHLMRKGKEGSRDGRKKKAVKRGGKREVDEFDDADDDGEEEDDYAEDEDEQEEEGDEDGEISGASDFDSEEDEESYDEESDDENVDYNASERSAKQGPGGVRVEENKSRRPYDKASPVDRRQASYTRRNGVQRKNNMEGKSYGRGNSPGGKYRSQARMRVSA